MQGEGGNPGCFAQFPEVVLFLPSLVDEEYHNEDGNAQDDVTDFVAVFRRKLIHLLGRLKVCVFVDGPSDGGQHAVPNAGSQGREEQEFAQIHLCQTCRYADELANCRNETSEEGRHRAVFGKIVFGLFHRCLIDETHVSETAVGKAVNDGATQPLGQVVIDNRSQVCTNGGEHYDEPDAHRAIGHGFPRSRRHHHFTGEGNKRTLDGHEYHHHPIVEVLQNPSENLCRIHYIYYMYVLARRR